MLWVHGSKWDIVMTWYLIFVILCFHKIIIIIQFCNWDACLGVAVEVNMGFETLVWMKSSGEVSEYLNGGFYFGICNLYSVAVSVQRLCRHLYIPMEFGNCLIYVTDDNDNYIC